MDLQKHRRWLRLLHASAERTGSCIASRIKHGDNTQLILGETTITGDYGRLTIRNDGTYSYKVCPGEYAGTDLFEIYVPGNGWTAIQFNLTQ